MSIEETSENRTPTAARARRKHPPGPANQLANVWNGIRASRDVLGYTGRLAAEYGDLVRIPIGPFAAYQVTDPRYAQQLLGRLSERFEKPKRLQRVFHPWLGQGLLFSEGAAWRRQRKWMEAALRQVDLDIFAAPSIAAMRKEASRHAGSRVDIVDLCERAAFLGLLESLFGEVDEAAAEQAYRDASLLQQDGVRRMTSLAPPRWLPTPANRRFATAMARFRDFITEQLARCRKSPGANLASRMLAASEQHEVGEEELFYGATNILFGGKAGVASLTWTAYALSRSPAVQDRAIEEIDSVTQRAPEPAHVEQLPYMQLTVKESFRLYPPVPMVTRQPRQPVELDGYYLQKNSFLYIGIVLMHRDERWFPEADQFQPERFQSSTPAMKAAYMPFGQGPHVCVGRSIAMRQLPMAMAGLLSECRLHWPDGAAAPRMAVDERLHPVGALNLDLEPR